MTFSSNAARTTTVAPPASDSTPGRRVTGSTLFLLAGLAALGALATNIILPAFPRRVSIVHKP